MVARRTLIKCVTLFFEFLPRATWALVVALEVPTALHMTGLDLFMRNLLLLGEQIIFDMIRDVLCKAPWFLHELVLGLFVQMVARGV